MLGTVAMTPAAIDSSTFETLSPSRFISFTVPNPLTFSPLRIAVLDSPLPSPHPPTTAALLVPPARRSDWLFSTPAGHLQLLLATPSLSLSRLILAGDPPAPSPAPFTAPSSPASDQVHEALLPLLLALAPRSAFADGVIPQIPFIAFDDDVIRSNPVEIVTGPIAGEMLVEDVGIGGSEQSEHRRRLRFKRMPNLVQTQVRLLPNPVDPTVLLPEAGSLVQPYLAPMAASLSLIAPHISRRRRPRALCIGVGGGALPMFLESKLGFDVVGVEADDVVLSLARRHFGLVEGEFINVCVGDGIELMKRLAETDAGGFDAVMVDLDEADAASGMSAPPLEFVEKSVLLAARAVLCKHGLLVVNVIPQGEGFYKGLVDSFREVFGELHELEVGNEENYVLIASNSVYGLDERAGGGDFCAKLKRAIGEGYIDKIRRL